MKYFVTKRQTVVILKADHRYLVSHTFQEQGRIKFSLLLNSRSVTSFVNKCELKSQPSRLGQGTVSHNFIETERVKQNEKAEEYVLNERMRNNP